MQIDVKTACRLLTEQDKIVILCHRKPDGDTLGSAFALLHILQALGKTARVDSPDGFPGKFDYLYGEYRPEAFEPAFVIAVDVGSEKLLGSLWQTYNGKIDLCIDHHQSNDFYAKATLLDTAAPATAQILYEIAAELAIEPTKALADAIFTGLTTDTGCFRFSSVTAKTHLAAAAAIAWGADHAGINKRMFLTKTKGRIAVEQTVMEQLAYYYQDKCILLYLPGDVQERFGVQEEDLDGISSLPTTIEGVYAGVTVKEQGDGVFRVSLRSVDPVNSSEICAAFGGGGHKNAAGCLMSGTLEEVREKLLAQVGKEFSRVGV